MKINVLQTVRLAKLRSRLRKCCRRNRDLKAVLMHREQMGALSILLHGKYTL